MQTEMVAWVFGVEKNKQHYPRKAQDHISSHVLQWPPRHQPMLAANYIYTRDISFRRLWNRSTSPATHT